MRILKFFDFYTEVFGWEIVPLIPKSKLPFMKGWNRGYYDKKTIREYLEDNPKCNIGLKLGRIIDVEGDTIQANNLLTKLTKKVPHPMYRSKKSVHHLFLTPDESLTRIVIHGMEFRGNFHQSVLPPSFVDVEYEWMPESKFPIPELPASLLDLYNKHSKMMKVKYNDKYIKPWCHVCCNKIKVNKERFILEVAAFEKISQKWQCRDCRSCDLRKICKKIKCS